MVPEKQIPIPTIERLSKVYGLCELLGGDTATVVSSAMIAAHLGASADVVRRDITYLGSDIGNNGSGYAIGRLRERIAVALDLARVRRACVVGLGRLGSAILEHDRFAAAGYEVVAGFDSSINRLETIHTRVRVYPAYEMVDVIRREQIEVALVTVPAEAAQQCADAAVSAGVRCVVNFAPVVVKVASEAVVRNVDIMNELRVVTAMARGRGSSAESSPEQHQAVVQLSTA